MNNKTLLTAVFALFAATPLQAAEFSQEARLGLNRVSIDPDDNTSTADPIIRGSNAEVSFFLAPVDTADAPLSEAAFLRHASSVTLAAAMENYESDDNNPANEEEIDALGYTLAARHVFGDNGWVIAGLVGRGEIEQEDVATNQEQNFDTESAEISISRYVQLHTELGITGRSDQVEEDGPGDDVGQIDQFSFWGKTVRSLDDGKFLSLWGEVGRQTADVEGFLVGRNPSNLDDDDFEGSFYKVGAAYFPNSMIELGAEISNVSSSVLLTSTAGIGDGFSAWAEYFVNEQASVAFSFARHTIDILDEEFDIDTIAVEGRVRF